MMRALLYVFAFLGVLGLGSWAYSENYAMRAKLSDVRGLNAEIAGLRDSLSTQRAEWAYLNRPNRLRELVNLNFERLRLGPMEPLQLGLAKTVAYPPAPPVLSQPEDLGITQPTAITGDLEAGQESVP